MKNPEASRSHDAPTLFTTLVRKGFAYLLARAPRSRLAAFASAFVALVFARQLLVPAHTSRPASAPSGRVFEGEFRRIHDPR